MIPEKKRIMGSGWLGLLVALWVALATPSPGNALSDGQLASAQVGPHADRIRSTLALVRISKNGRSSSCSGVFLSSRIVLTAGHCLLDEEFKEAAPSSVSVSRCLDPKIKSCRWIEAKGFEIQPFFKRRAELAGHLEKKAAKSEKFEIKRFHQWTHDLAVVYLANHADNVGSIPLTLAPPSDGEIHFHYGAGQTPKLDDGKMRVAAFLMAWSVSGSRSLLSQYLLVASKTSGNCPGDSGGPIFVERDGQLWIAGLGVAAKHREKKSLCGDVAVIATDLNYQRDWIEPTIRKIQREHSAPPQLHPAVRSAIDRLGIGKRM